MLNETQKQVFFTPRIATVLYGSYVKVPIRENNTIIGGIQIKCYNIPQALWNNVASVHSYVTFAKEALL